MNDHVAVLRVLRDFYAGSVLNHAEKAAALDHAIAAVAERDALTEELRCQNENLSAHITTLRDERQAHRALVARLVGLEQSMAHHIKEDGCACCRMEGYTEELLEIIKDTYD